MKTYINNLGAHYHRLDNINLPSLKGVGLVDSRGSAF